MGCVRAQASLRAERARARWRVRGRALARASDRFVRGGRSREVGWRSVSTSETPMWRCHRGSDDGLCSCPWQSRYCLTRELPVQSVMMGADRAHVTSSSDMRVPRAKPMCDCQRRSRMRIHHQCDNSRPRSNSHGATHCHVARRSTWTSEIAKVVLTACARVVPCASIALNARTGHANAPSLTQIERGRLRSPIARTCDQAWLH